MAWNVSTPPQPGMVWDAKKEQWVWPPGTGPRAADAVDPAGTAAPAGAVGPNGLSNGANTTPGAPISTTLVDAAGNPVKIGPGGFSDTASSYYGGAAAGEDAAEARRQRDAWLADYKAAQPRQAPQAAAPGAIPVAQTGGVTIGGPQVATAAPVAPAAQATTPTVGPATHAAPVAPIGAGQVKAATIAPTGPAGVGTATAAPVFAATIDKSEQSAFRDDQRNLTQQLQDASAGKVPSAAELQMQRANSQSLADQLSLAAGVHGYGGLVANQQAGRNIARLQSQNALDTGLLRAKEQETARGQLAGVLGTGREQDIGLATKQGEFEQQANVVGSQLKTDVSKTNAGLITDIAKTNAQLDSERAVEQARLNQGADTTSAGLALDAAKSNQNVDLQTGLTNAQADNRMKELQAQLAAQGGQFNAGQENEMAKLRAQLETATSQYNAGQANDITKLGAQLNTQVDLANTGAINTANLANLDANTKTSLANLNAQLQSRELDDRQKTALMQAWLQANSSVLQMDAAYNSVSAGKDFTWRDGVALVNGAAGGIAAAVASDKRLKKDIKAVSEDAVANLAEKLRTYEYKYKDDPNGETHVGVMAQDLERDPLGKVFVRKGSDGMRAVDYQGLTAALLAHAIRGKKRAAT